MELLDVKSRSGGKVEKRTRLVLYILLVIFVFGSIAIIWAIDTGRIAGHADVGPVVQSADELQTLPNPDQSTFSKIFGAILSPFVGK